LKSAESSTFIGDRATIWWYETYRVKSVCVAENVTTKALFCCKSSVVSRRSTDNMPSHSSQLRFRSKCMLDAPIDPHICQRVYAYFDRLSRTVTVRRPPSRHPVLLVIFGAIVGWIASTLVGRSSKMGCGANVVGILGSIIGGFVVHFFSPFPRAAVVGRFNLYSIAVGVLGAVVLLVVTGWFKKQ
jgi:uncharacterized membrane protein YeaQ/YmgE (transglycosylase-associated protein family)